MMKVRTWIALVLSFTLIEGGCEFRKDKPQPQQGGADRFETSEARTVSYRTVVQRIFAQNCVSCHGSAGGVNLESYEAVKANLGRIEKSVLVDKTMPKGRVLGQAESRLLRIWILAGAPENPPDAEPPAPIETLRPNFASIRKLVFESRCMSCHTAGGQASRVPLDTLNDLLTSPRELVLRGNPAESGLIIALTREDGKRMPPPENAGPLSSDEIAVIRRWIEIGAPASDASPGK